MLPSQKSQLRNVESRMNEGVDNPGLARAPSPVWTASHPVSWQLPCPPCGTRPAPQGSGQLRVPGMGGGGLFRAWSGQTWCRDGDRQNHGGRELPPNSVPGSGSWKGSWARQAGGGKAIREGRREHCCEPCRGSTEAGGGACTALPISSHSQPGNPWDTQPREHKALVSRC